MADKFIRGNDRIAKALADPARRERVDAIRAEMAQDDRAYKMSLAALRKAAELTQVEVAERLGVGQGEVSRIENRGDMLLSTLASYLSATGATDIAITATVGGKTVSVPLAQPTA